MATAPARTIQSKPPATPSKHEGEVRSDERTDEHKARVRASLEWALVEYDSVLAKLAK